MLLSASLLFLASFLSRAAIAAPATSGGANSNARPQPIQGDKGAKIIGPENVPLEIQNPSALAPPSTDHGEVPNMKWPFSLSHNGLYPGGWARQQNVNDLPVAKELAGVNLRLEPGTIRELHWHNTAEWAYMLKGDVRISTITPEGQVYIGDVSEGDLWYFPAGNPHSLQAKNTTADGAEAVLIFDNGAFSAESESTFLITDWLAHVPKKVLGKNFGIQDLSIFDHIPKEELYIFKSSPPPEDAELDMVIPNNTPNPYTFKLSKVEPVRTQHGSFKVVDSRTFKVAEKISAVEVTVDVGGIRELHWHPTQPEWSYFISGEARMTVFASGTNSRTFDLRAGDIGYVPPSFGHYVENTGNTTLKFLEVFKSDVYQDLSLTQWLALTPPEMVAATLGIPKETIAKFNRTKQVVV